MRITSIIESLQEQLAVDQINLAECLRTHGDTVDQYDDVLEAAHPIVDAVLDESGSDGLKTMCNFTSSEFEILYGIVQSALTTRWTSGRGKKSPTSPKDALFMTLTVMKHFQSWEMHATHFKYKAPTFQKIITKVISVVEPLLYGHFVQVPTMTDLRNKGTVFSNYPYALYATDVKFQPSERPKGRFNEQRHYFSGKHKLYGLKVEASVAPDGRCVDMSQHCPGSVADLTMLLERLDVHRVFGIKVPIGLGT